MTKLSKNIIADLLFYIGFLLLLGTGLLLEYVLPHGSGQIAGRGTGRASGEKLVTTLWGMTRDQWGEIHFWISVAVLVVLAVHLLLHWKWIVNAVRGRKKPGDRSRGRLVWGSTGLLGLLAVLILPFVVPTEQATRNQFMQQTETLQPAGAAELQNPRAEDRDEAGRGRARAQQTETLRPAGAPGVQSARAEGRDEAGRGRRQAQQTETSQPAGAPEVRGAGTEEHDETIRGDMTLLEVQDEIGIPYQKIIEKLDLPKDTSPNERLGRLTRSYGFSVDDIRSMVEGQSAEAEEDDETIRGSMTLMEVQDKTGISYQDIIKKLGLPKDTSPNERLGRLKRSHGLSIDDVRKMVNDYRP